MKTVFVRSLLPFIPTSLPRSTPDGFFPRQLKPCSTLCRSSSSVSCELPLSFLSNRNGPRPRIKHYTAIRFGTVWNTKGKCVRGRHISLIMARHLGLRKERVQHLAPGGRVDSADQTSVGKEQHWRHAESRYEHSGWGKMLLWPRLFLSCFVRSIP